ncbi:hypothetical protein TRVA0_004S02454 [Trichomonascus vanleenenianus]|uniref:uncharacterized protein n=1 Tax=Trichomonascus vanleenenianus TaxID=2268995 RepID=UPI003ECBA85D
MCMCVCVRDADIKAARSEAPAAGAKTLSCLLKYTSAYISIYPSRWPSNNMDNNPPSRRASLDSIDLHPVGERSLEELRAIQDAWDQIEEVDLDEFLDNGRPGTPMPTEDNPVSGVGSIRTYKRSGYPELYDDPTQDALQGPQSIAGDEKDNKHGKSNLHNGSPTQSNNSPPVEHASEDCPSQSQPITRDSGDSVDSNDSGGTQASTGSPPMQSRSSLHNQASTTTIANPCNFSGANSSPPTRLNKPKNASAGANEPLLLRGDQEPASTSAAPATEGRSDKFVAITASGNQQCEPNKPAAGIDTIQAVSHSSLLQQPVDSSVLEAMQVSDLDLDEGAEQQLASRHEAALLGDYVFDFTSYQSLNPDLGALASPFTEFQAPPDNGDASMDQFTADPWPEEDDQQGFQRRPNGTFTLGNLIFPFDEELEGNSSPLFQTPTQFPRYDLTEPAPNPQSAHLPTERQAQNQGQPLTYQNRTSTVRDFAFRRPVGVARPIPPHFTPLTDGQLFHSPATAAWAAEYHRRNASPGHIVPTAEDFERGRVIAYHRYNQTNNNAPPPPLPHSPHPIAPPAGLRPPVPSPQLPLAPPPPPEPPREYLHQVRGSTNQRNLNFEGAMGNLRDNLAMADFHRPQQYVQNQHHIINTTGNRRPRANNTVREAPNLVPNPMIWNTDDAFFGDIQTFGGQGPIGTGGEAQREVAVEPELPPLPPWEMNGFTPTRNRAEYEAYQHNGRAQPARPFRGINGLQARNHLRLDINRVGRGAQREVVIQPPRPTEGLELLSPATMVHALNGMIHDGNSSDTGSGD